MDLTAQEEKIKKAIAGQIEKTIEELHNGYLQELEQAREKLAEDYEAFTDTQAKFNLEVAENVKGLEKRVADLEIGKSNSGYLFEAFVPAKSRVRFMDGQRKAAAALGATKSGKQAQKIAYTAADALVDCLELEDKAPRIYHLNRYELAGVVLGGAVLGVVGLAAVATSATTRQLKKHGRTPADLQHWLERKPIETKHEVADNVVQLEPARAAAMARVK
jgi:hypothetical protein